MITEQKNRLKPLFLLCEDDLGPVSAPYLDQLITIEKAKLGPANNYITKKQKNIYIYIYIPKHTQPHTHQTDTDRQRPTNVCANSPPKKGTNDNFRSCSGIWENIVLSAPTQTKF